MDENDSGWDFVLISNPSSTYKKSEKLIIHSLRLDTRANLIECKDIHSLFKERLATDGTTALPSIDSPSPPTIIRISQVPLFTSHAASERSR
jgi:hypothetical protein